MTCSLEINIFQTEFLRLLQEPVVNFLFSHLHGMETKHFAEFDLSFERRKKVTEKAK